MVTSVQPSGYAPLTPPQGNPRLPKTGNDNSAGDLVTLSSSSDAGGALDSLAQAQSATDLALAAGREGAALLSQVRDLARGAVGAARGDLNTQLQALLKQYGATIGGAVQAGASLLAGGSLSVSLDPNAPPVTLAGYDLRLKDSPGAEDALRLSTASNLDDSAAAAATARDADASLARVDTALGRLSAAAQKVSAHNQFLSVFDSTVASAVDEPSDADGARLLALQTSQGLGASGSSIANAAPQAVLALFR